MSKLLHIAASPRGEDSESLRIARTFLDAYRDSHPDHEIETWDLWDGTLPPFGRAAATAKMAVIGGAVLSEEEAAAWTDVQATIDRFLVADRLLFSIPMWNGSVPYILKQFVDVVSQPSRIWGLDVTTGYIPLLKDTGRKARVIYASGVWGPGLGPEFGRNFQAPFVEDWLRWMGIFDIATIGFHPTLTGDVADARQAADADARALAKTF